MNQKKPNRAAWLFLPVAVCLFLVTVGAPALMVIPLMVASSLIAGFGTGAFQALARRRLFAVLLGGVLGVTGLYFGVIFLMVASALPGGFAYFDPGVMSHWAEWFFLPLFMLGSLPIGFRVFVMSGSALVGIAVMTALRPRPTT